MIELPWLEEDERALERVEAGSAEAKGDARDDGGCEIERR